MSDFVINDAQPMRGTLIDAIRVIREYINRPLPPENTLIGNKTGTIVTADDAFPNIPKGAKVYGKSTQDGTPTPDAPVPIMSVDDLTLHVCGKNLFAYPTEPWTNTSGVLYNGYNFSGGYRPIPAGVTTITASMFIDNSAATNVSRINCWARKSDGTVVAIGSSTEVNAGSKNRVSRTYDVSQYREFALGVYLQPNATASQLMAEIGSTLSEYEPYIGTTIPVSLDNHIMRSLPDGTCDELMFTYIEPSEREGWGVFRKTLTQLIGSTTTAETDGITGTVGVDILSTTGEIADGPTVIYKLTTPQTYDLNTIELPVLYAPNFTFFANGGNAQPDVQISYERDITIVIDKLEAAETPVGSLSISPVINHTIEPAIEPAILQEETEWQSDSI